MRLSILMPVYNEVQTVRRAIREVLETELPVEWELIVVDDGSTDGTGEVLDRSCWGERVRVLHHESNRGKGAALATALGTAQGDFSAVFDADLEYSASDLARISRPLIEGKSNAVFGVRAFNGHSSHSFWYVVGNKFVTLAANLLFNVYFGDLMCCHKAIRTTLFKSLGCREAGFAVEAEIAARLVQAGERVFEIPVDYTARPTEEGKKLRASDGVRVLGTLLRCRFGQ